MRLKTNKTTIGGTTPRQSNALPKTKSGLKKLNEGQTKSKRGQNRLNALQEALQDPITSCEGI